MGISSQAMSASLVAAQRVWGHSATPFTVLACDDYSIEDSGYFYHHSSRKLDSQIETFAKVKQSLPPLSRVHVVCKQETTAVLLHKVLVNTIGKVLSVVCTI